MTATTRVEYESAEWRQLRAEGWQSEHIYLPDDGGEVMALMRAPALLPKPYRVASLEEIAADLDALGPTGSAS